LKLIFSLFIFLISSQLFAGEIESYPGYRVTWSNLGSPKKIVIEDYGVRQNFGLDEKTLRLREVKNYTVQGFLASKVSYGPGDALVDQISNVPDQAGNVSERMRIQGLSEMADKWVYTRTNIAGQNGLVVSELRYQKDGKVRSKNTYDFDSEGRWTNRLFYNESGLVEYRQTQSFESNGNKLDLVTWRSTGHIQDKTLWSWSNNLLQSENWYNMDGELVRRTIWTYAILTNGFKDPVKSEEKIFRGDGELRESSKFFYDASGQLVRRDTADGGGVFRSKSIYKYDTSGKKMEEAQYKSDTLIDLRFVYSYDAKGNPIEVRQEKQSVMFGEINFELKQLLKINFEY
jgi:hypothetical protein